MSFIAYFIVLVDEINQRLERRTNAEWKRMNEARKEALEEISKEENGELFLSGAVKILTPIKKKLGP